MQGRLVAIDATVQRRPPGGLVSAEDAACNRLTELALNDVQVCLLPCLASHTCYHTYSMHAHMHTLAQTATRRYKPNTICCFDVGKLKSSRTSCADSASFLWLSSVLQPVI